ncbi:unnamed protein product, partial [Ectocarpus sp. 12 AP-2014]
VLQYRCTGVQNERERIANLPSPAHLDVKRRPICYTGDNININTVYHFWYRVDAAFSLRSLHQQSRRRYLHDADFPQAVSSGHVISLRQRRVVEHRRPEVI